MKDLRTTRREQEGKLTKDQILKRLHTLLNMIYLESERIDSSTYSISSRLRESIQTELDFCLSRTTSRKSLSESIKARYRKRDSYKFWANILDNSSLTDRNKAKEFLLSFYDKFNSKGVYGSMTHARYALETLELALDDTFNTDELLLHQVDWAFPKKKKTPKKKAKAPKANAKKPNKSYHNADLPF